LQFYQLEMSLGNPAVDFSQLWTNESASNGSDTALDRLDRIQPNLTVASSLSASRQLPTLKNAICYGMERCASVRLSSHKKTETRSTLTTNNRSNFENPDDDTTLIKSCRSRWPSSSRRVAAFISATPNAEDPLDGYQKDTKRNLDPGQSILENLDQSTNDAASDKTRRISNLSDPLLKEKSVQSDESSLETSGDSDGSSLVSDYSTAVELTLSAWCSLFKDFTRDYWLTMKAATYDLASLCIISGTPSLLHLQRDRDREDKQRDL
jgi:hypothetical protein